MVKRNDLAKQFELIVQQEIKNHNASILATNQAINGMKDQIQNLIQEFAKHTARNDAWFKKTHDEFLHIERTLDKRISANELKNVSLERSQKVSSDYIWAEIEKLDADHLDLDEFQNYKDSMKMEIGECYKRINDQNDYVRAATYKIKKDLDGIVNKFIEDIENKPDHLWDVKEELENKIAAAAVDSKGVLKELQVHKREVFVMEKKIENIYSIIEKLKEKL